MIQKNLFIFTFFLCLCTAIDSFASFEKIEVKDILPTDGVSKKVLSEQNLNPDNCKIASLNGRQFIVEDIGESYRAPLIPLDLDKDEKPETVVYCQTSCLHYRIVCDHDKDTHAPVAKNDLCYNKKPCSHDAQQPQGCRSLPVSPTHSGSTIAAIMSSRSRSGLQSLGLLCEGKQ
jgi:hypothetical protein